MDVALVLEKLVFPSNILNKPIKLLYTFTKAIPMKTLKKPRISTDFKFLILKTFIYLKHILLHFPADPVMEWIHNYYILLCL